MPKGTNTLCLKPDLSKAFDSVRWDFLELALTTPKFQPKSILLIMECISSPALSVLDNGTAHSFFQSSKGLRQGCPLFPYLFCIAMEFFSAAISKAISNGMLDGSYSHAGLNISQLLSANDTMIFAKTSGMGAANLKILLTDFVHTTSLSVNCRKSSSFFSNSNDELTKSIVSYLYIEEKQLPKKYLGIPLFSARMRMVDCRPIVDKNRKVLSGWKSATVFCWAIGTFKVCYLLPSLHLVF